MPQDDGRKSRCRLVTTIINRSNHMPKLTMTECRLSAAIGTRYLPGSQIRKHRAVPAGSDELFGAHGAHVVLVRPPRQSVTTILVFQQFCGLSLRIFRCFTWHARETLSVLLVNNRGAAHMRRTGAVRGGPRPHFLVRRLSFGSSALSQDLSRLGRAWARSWPVYLRTSRKGLSQ